jgi:hypothetical protein
MCSQAAEHLLTLDKEKFKMAHFAEIDENNLVLTVQVINNSDILDENGNESEQKGIEFCKRLWPDSNRWVQTSYNRTFRKNYAGVGYMYDEQKDAFIPPKPYASWVLNEEIAWWEAPVVSPFNGTDGKFYSWDEDIKDWVEITNVAILE